MSCPASHRRCEKMKVFDCIGLAQKAAKASSASGHSPRCSCSLVMVCPIGGVCSISLLCAQAPPLQPTSLLLCPVSKSGAPISIAQPKNDKIASRYFVQGHLIRPRGLSPASDEGEQYSTTLCFAQVAVNATLLLFKRRTVPNGAKRSPHKPDSCRRAN